MITGIPRNNAIALSIVLDIMRRVLAGQALMADQAKALSMSFPLSSFRFILSISFLSTSCVWPVSISHSLDDDGVARIFSGILFAEALTFGPIDSTQVAALKIMHAKEVILVLIRFVNFVQTIQ
jgi:hypothetical protein